MTAPDDTAPPESPATTAPVRYWDPWMTVSLSGVALLVVHGLLAELVDRGMPRIPGFIPSLANHPPALETWLNPVARLVVVTLLKVPVAVMLLDVFIRLRRESFSRYLGLRFPGVWACLRWVGVLLLVVAAMDVARLLLGRPVVPEWMEHIFETTPSVPLLALAVVVAAPAWEELVFRGFLLPGLAASRLGSGGAVVLTSALFALLHLQYDLFDMATVFLLGVVLGTARLRTGSTGLTFLLHALVNLIALVQVLLKAGGFLG